jgi:hypothetical protein
VRVFDDVHSRLGRASDAELINAVNLRRRVGSSLASSPWVLMQQI